MDVKEAIEKRRSIRKYMEVPVEWEKVVEILEAGKAAPSSGNIQNWRFIVVASNEKRREVAEAALQQYWMETAPLFIVVCAITKRSVQFYGLRGERLYDVQNCAAAIENMLLTATSLNLGSCWVGAFDEDMLKRALNIPAHVRPQAILTFGYPDEKVPEPTEYPIYTVTNLEKWDGRIGDPAASMHMYSEIIGRNVKKGVEVVKKVAAKAHEKVKEKIKEKKK